MDQVKMEEMIKVVQDAGMYEENMSKEDLENYYKAIANSKDTSTLEDEARKCDSEDDMFMPSPVSPHVKDNVNTNLNDNSSEDANLFQPKVWSVDKNILDKEEPTETGKVKTSQDASKANFGFRDMPKTKEKTLDVIYHSVQFNSIQNSETFLHADTLTRAMLLYSYHTKMEKLRSQLARQSFFTVSIPKPIVLKEIFTPSFELDNDFEETYVSRSGRQTKRKIYNEFDEDSMDSTSNKKPKAKTGDEAPWQSKTKTPSKTVPKKIEVLPKVETLHKAESFKKTKSKQESMEVERTHG